MNQKEHFELKDKLNNKLDEYMKELKDMYWERDGRFKIEGIDFNKNEEDRPHISY